MRAAHAPEDFYLNLITLPALAYGASMSGITVDRVTQSTTPLRLVKDHVTPPR